MCAPSRTLMQIQNAPWEKASTTWLITLVSAARHFALQHRSRHRICPWKRCVMMTGGSVPKTFIAAPSAWLHPTWDGISLQECLSKSCTPASSRLCTHHSTHRKPCACPTQTPHLVSHGHSTAQRHTTRVHLRRTQQLRKQRRLDVCRYL